MSAEMEANGTHVNGSAEDTKTTVNTHESGPASIPSDNHTLAQSTNHGLSSQVGTPVVASQDAAVPSVKTEPGNEALESFLGSDDMETKSVGLDGADDHPTSKKLANLKQGLTSRASSSDRSSPATSVKPAATKKTGTSTTKKGTGKKPTAKKRKMNDPDADSLDGRRSNTPVSRTDKIPGKKQGTDSIAGSPAPEEKKKPKPKKRGKGPAAADDEDYDENEVFCICRRPDNHTWMIGCDGDCEDWYHGKCVNIDPRDAELIDRYICRSFPLILKHKFYLN